MKRWTSFSGCCRERVAGRRIVLIAALLVAGFLAPARANDVPEAVSACLDCHGMEGTTMELEDGSEVSLYVEAERFLGSVHGEHLVCTDCHEGYAEDHPMGESFASPRAYAVAYYDVCKKCHFETYTRTLESVHYELLQSGDELAPVCADCHGAHDIPDPHEKRAMMSQSCAVCHMDVYGEYAESVHGRALVEEGVEDVPACVDCHTAHSVEHPDTARFHMASPQICIDCHGDADLMQKYDILPTVASTYMTDFHGVTATLADPEDVEQRQLVVTCVDCHGVHDIASPERIGADTMKERVREVCADCHEGAPPDFPAAWLSHFPPSLQHAPLVYLIDLFYRFFIPFMVVGLVLQVLLHLYRVAIRK